MRAIVRVGGNTTGSLGDGGANAGGVVGVVGIDVTTGGKIGNGAAGIDGSLFGVVAACDVVSDGVLARGGAAVTVGSSGGWITGSEAGGATDVDVVGLAAAGVGNVGAESGAVDAVNAGPRMVGATVGLDGATFVGGALSGFGFVTAGANANGAIGGNSSCTTGAVEGDGGKVEGGRVTGCGGARVGMPVAGAASVGAAVGCGGASVGSLRGCSDERGCNGDVTTGCVVVGAGAAKVGAGAVGVGTRICNCEPPGLPPPAVLGTGAVDVAAFDVVMFDDVVVRFVSPIRSVLRGGVACGAPIAVLRVDCASDSAVDPATIKHTSAARQ